MSKPLTREAREQFLADSHVAVLSVASDRAGRPPVCVPIWYEYEPGANLIFNTGKTSQKAKLIPKTGVITLTVQSVHLPYCYVVVEGTVIDQLTPTPIWIRERIASRYLGDDGGRQFVARTSDHESTLFTVRPDRWRTADFKGEL